MAAIGVLPVSLISSSPCASVPFSHASFSLLGSHPCVCVRPAPPISCPFPVCDLPPLPSAARAEGKEMWRGRGGEPGGTSSWLGRE